MPEGPEVKTITKTLINEIVGKELGYLWHSPYSLRREPNYLAIKRYENLTIDKVNCYGKVIFIYINNNPAIFVQLGMTGQLLVLDQDAPLAKHTHIRWPFNHTNKELRYVDQRRFGLLDVCSQQIKENILTKLGPDPFYITKKDYLRLINAMKDSNRQIKEVLLDQSIIAGVGNIYASEALFEAGINPQIKACHISEALYKKLILSIIKVMKLAYKNSGTTFSDYVDGTGKKGGNLGFLKVFQRKNQPCTKCSSLIQRIKQGGRSTFFCSQCQKWE